tara:strand:- start:144 stop:296 length:153 start_codon:yes stop_codon:yes gene_type:complete
MDSKKTEYNIPEGGSLGLLALGDIGLIKWREKKAKIKSLRINENKPKKDE